MAGPSPLVSILIPCYNAGPWIAQCIQSALDQTWPNTEIVVIDDGSSDDSVDIVRGFGERVVFKASAHAGGNAVRNELARMANGEWCSFLDADDYLLPTKISSQMALAESAGPSVAVVYSPVTIQDTSRPGEDYSIAIEETDDLLALIRWAPFCTSGLLFRRDAVLNVGNWKVDQPCCQEHELLSRLLMGGYKFALQNTAETIYRKHGEGSVSRRDPLRVIRLRMEITDRVARYFESKGQLLPEHRKAIYIALLESARTASKCDPELAGRLGAEARALGNWWVSSSPALPLGYQLILRFAGFRRTERIAAWLQSQKQNRFRPLSGQMPS